MNGARRDGWIRVETCQRMAASVEEPAMRFAPRAIICMLGVGLVVPALSGCQNWYPVEVRGVVRSSADGSPMGGVRVILLTPGARWISNDGTVVRVRGENDPTITGDDGSFVFKFEADWGPGTRWELALSRDGYEGESVMMPLSQDPRTSSHSGSWRIFVFAYMRPKG